MPNLNYAEQWSPELLEILMQGTLTSPFVTSNVRWLDAKTFHFTRMATSGYKNHSRAGGWNKGNYVQEDVPFTLTHDRDISFIVDKADVDETNATASIQNISRVFEQTQVVPETDALFFSKVAKVAQKTDGYHSSTASSAYTKAKVFGMLKDILAKYNDYSKDNIEKISEEYMLCPFELSLDLTNLSDVIICDYNYVFDPRVYLKRFFDTKTTDYTFLIDEAHNLVDRAREMYSATLNEEKFVKVKKLISKKDKRITRVIKEIQSYFEDKLEDLTTLDENDLVESEAPLELCEILSSFIKFVDEYLARTNEENEELMDLYFDVYSFLLISDFYDKNYTTIYTKTFNGMTIKIYCVNPQKVIEEKMKKAKSNIIFSATLIPMDYFMKMYSYDEEDFIINLKSPFDVKNRLLMIGDNVATTYSKRFETSCDIASYIANCVQAKKGNYMVFFPSYKYMDLVFDKMKENYPNINTSIQESNMSEEEKEEFLSMFDEDNKETHVVFCVLGGHFSEGIYLTNDKLIGVIIVGVGMPQTGIERDIIKDHMKDSNKGFDYAYVYPGMIKVLQAAGRCIRTDDDKGVILLLDNRYSQRRYQSLFPYEWYPNFRVRKSDDVKTLCEEFWNK